VTGARAEEPRRTEKISPTLENYVKTIYIICQTAPCASLRDVIGAAHRSKPTVFRALNVLTALELTEKIAGKGVILTPRGRLYAEGMLERRDVVSRFLRETLKLDPRIAEADAERIAHGLSAETFNSLRDFCAAPHGG
jgi:DtxR family Mn-dependent transcriptional regulator